MSDIKFWFNLKSKELKTIDDGHSHAHAMGIHKLCGDDKECSNYRMRELQNLGWIRGFFSPKRELNLSISSQYKNDIDKILETLPYEYLLVNRLFIDIDGIWDLQRPTHGDYDIRVDLNDGEDALTAWKRKR